MSFKTKFSISISMVVMLLFMLLIILNEYSIARNIRQWNERTLQEVSGHAASYLAGADTDEKKRELAATLEEMVRGIKPNIREMALLNPSASRVLYGSGRYFEPADGYYSGFRTDSGFRVRQTKLNNSYYVKSYYTDASIAPYTIMTVYDVSEIRNALEVRLHGYMLVFGASTLFILLCSYGISAFMLRPLKQILWKVNEVSLGRFQTVIKVKGSDEFGLLALKVNAMSQNLSIYMDKLRNAFEENRRMKEYLESFINHTSDAIHVEDLQGNVIQVNQAFEKLFEYRAEEALGSKLELVPDSNKIETRLIKESLQAGKVVPAQETVRVSKSGEVIPVSVTVSAIRDSSGTIQGFASITRDMRSRNKMEELLKRSEKLTMVGELAAGVAHEIRNPLTTLRGFLQMQRQMKTVNVEHTDLMLSELDRINLIVGEFLILAKPQAFRMRDRDVRTVFNEVLSLLESEAHLHNVIFRKSFANEPCIVTCEDNQLKQVFINVLKNAIEAMPRGGRVHIHIAAKQGHVVITITDEGEGIPEEVLEKIGQPFVTSKENGTGLGMMISQRIIHGHNGTLDIQSQRNVGTTVTITLPALKDERADVILEA
ncbi:ATP-binding protein [Paenibacillus thailandensis]|uniref:histidine kinase n=1 Tax=Paenibacillus thailandensis TaxID=393250 RepID=A0ABW5R1J5_9BACL